MHGMRSLETKIRDIMIDVCEVLHRNGYKSVTLGALMRLLGIDHEAAKKYDSEVYDLGNDFEALLDMKDHGMLEDPAPGTLIH